MLQADVDRPWSPTGPEVMSRLPLSRASASLHAREALALALVSTDRIPTPLSATRQHQPRALDTQVDLHTRRSREWRAAVVDRFLENQEQIPANIHAQFQLSALRRVEAQLDVARVKTSSACCRIRRVRSSRLSRFGLIAQTMSLIELTDSRAMRGDGRERPVGATARVGAGCPAGDFTQQGDARQVGADIVVQIRGDPRAHVRDLEQPRDAIAIHGPDIKPTAMTDSARNHQRSQTGRRTVKVTTAG